MNGLFAFFTAALFTAAPLPTSDLAIDVERLRSDKGVVHACLTRDRAQFPDCKADPKAFRQTVPAKNHMIRFSGVPAGAYALTLVHDENNNQHLDTVLGIPREGFGFSGNPTIRFGAPKFDQVVIQLKPGLTRQIIRMQYLL